MEWKGGGGGEGREGVVVANCGLEDLHMQLVPGPGRVFCKLWELQKNIYTRQFDERHEYTDGHFKENIIVMKKFLESILRF